MRPIHELVDIGTIRASALLLRDSKFFARSLDSRPLVEVASESEADVDDLRSAGEQTVSVDTPIGTFEAAYLPWQWRGPDYDVFITDEVLEELHEIASYDDVHGHAATAVLDRIAGVTVHSVELDAKFPLDDGENAAVTLANEFDVALFLCDEFNSLGLVHASLADTRLVTTPTLLSTFVRTGRLMLDEARTFLEDISTARSWDANSYVQQARSLLDGS